MAETFRGLVAAMEVNLRNYRHGMEQAQREEDRRFGEIDKRMMAMEDAFAKAFKEHG